MIASREWRAISIRQPYAFLVVQGVKQYEARSWWPANLGSVLIHASQSFATGWREDVVTLAALAGLGLTADDVGDLPRGAIVGCTTITSVVYPDDEDAHAEIPSVDRYLCADNGDTYGLCLWRLEKSKAFKNPATCKGSLNLWRVPPQTIAKIARDN